MSKAKSLEHHGLMIGRQGPLLMDCIYNHSLMEIHLKGLPKFLHMNFLKVIK